MQHDVHELHKHGDCQHLLGDLSDYLDSEEAAESVAESAAKSSAESWAKICAEIEEHMTGCEDCRAVIDTLRKTIELYRTMPQPDLPDGARQRLYRALDLP